MYPCGADLAGTDFPQFTYVNGQFDDNVIHNGMQLFVDAYHALSVADICYISFILLNFLGVTVHWKVVTQTYVATNSRNAEVSLLNLSVDCRIANQMMISSRLMNSPNKYKILWLPSVTSMNTLISRKSIGVRYQHIYNILTWVKSISMFLFLNVIYLASVVYTSTPLINMIIFIILISILALCLGLRLNSLFDYNTLPYSFPIISLSPPFTLYCWYFMVLIYLREIVNGPSTCFQVLFPVLSVPVPSTF